MTTSTPLWELPTNTDMILRHLTLEGQRVVDVGAGKGALARFMRSHGADVVAVECGEAMISVARAADPEHVDSYVEGVGQDLPVDDASADIVILLASLHHIPAADMADSLAEASRVLRSGGTLAVLEPVAEGPGFETHKPIDDETAVRALAQAALDNDLPPDLSERERIEYMTAYAYSGIDELERTVVDIDPTRRAAFDVVRDEVEQLFKKNAVRHDGKFWFAQPGLMRLFTKG